MPDELNCLGVTVVAGLPHLDYFGQTSGEPYEEMLAAVVAEEVSTILASLSLRGPDDGANGTRNWDLCPLADGATQFPNLRALSIERTKPADHNRSIVAASYEEEGVLGRLLARPRNCSL